MNTLPALSKIVFRLLSIFLFLTLSEFATAQPYFRLSPGAEGGSGACEFYDYERWPDLLPKYEPYRGRFGSGWFLDGEFGLRISKNLEVGFNCTLHSKAIAVAYNKEEVDSFRYARVRRYAELDAPVRVGISACYYLGKRNVQPFVTLGVRTLVQPHFQKSYIVDTLPFARGGPYYSISHESYSGGVSIGYLVGAGISSQRTARFSASVQFNYTWQQWKPRRMDNSLAYNTNSRGEELSSNNPNIRIPMNAIGFSVGLTFLLLKPDTVETLLH